MGTCKITYLEETSQSPQEIEADGYYQHENRFDFYQDSAAGEQQIYCLDGADVERVENLTEQAKADNARTYRITYQSDRDPEDIRADGYSENGEWLDFYCDSMVGEKVVLSLKISLVGDIEQI